MRMKALISAILAIGLFGGCSRMMTGPDERVCQTDPCALPGEYAVVDIQVLDCCATYGEGKTHWWGGGEFKLDSQPRFVFEWMDDKKKISFTTLPKAMVQFEIDETKVTATVEWRSCAERKSCTCCCANCLTRREPACNHNRRLSNENLKYGNLCVAVVKISSAQMDRDVRKKPAHSARPSESKYY